MRTIKEAPFEVVEVEHNEEVGSVEPWAWTSRTSRHRWDERSEGPSLRTLEVVREAIEYLGIPDTWPLVDTQARARPVRAYSTSIVSLGDDKLTLRAPVVVTLEDYDSEIVASWPEIEAWGAGSSESEAINALKDEIATMYWDLRDTPDEDLGRLPRRWKRALAAVLSEVP